MASQQGISAGSPYSPGSLYSPGPPNSTGSPYSPEYLAQSRVPQILAGTIIPTLLCTVAVLARFYTHGVITKNLGVDDTLIGLGWLSVLGLLTTNLLLVHHGAGHHAALLTLEDAITSLQLTYASKILYIFGLTATKLGIAKFYLRICTNRTSTYFAYIIIAEVLITGIVLEALVIFQCTRISGLWDLKPAHCMLDKYQFFLTMGSNVLGDVLLIVFAIPRILPLNLSRSQKASLLVVVSLGFLVITSSIMRLVRILQFDSNPDMPWVAPDAIDFTTIEVCTSLFCASAPMTRPLIRQIFPCLISSNGSSDHRYITYWPNSRTGGGREQSDMQTDVTTSHSKIWLDNNSESAVIKREDVP